MGAGRYEEGFDAIQRMVDLEPSRSSYARVSYGRELQGNVAAATEALQAAARVAPGRPEQAFAAFQLGELHWNAGRVGEAVAAYRRASALDAGFVAPQAALARAAWAEGRTEEAIEAYRGVVERLPAPQYLTELADLFTVTGQADKAREQFSLLDAQQRILAANGVNVDLEASLFSADHGIGLAQGLAAARSEWEGSKSVFVADALAWQLHANGRDTEALVYADQALRLGTANACSTSTEARSASPSAIAAEHAPTCNGLWTSTPTSRSCTAPRHASSCSGCGPKARSTQDYHELGASRGAVAARRRGGRALRAATGHPQMSLGVVAAFGSSE